MDPLRPERPTRPNGQTHHPVRERHEGEGGRAHRFRYGFVISDAAAILFIVISSSLPRMALVEGIDVVIGLAVLIEFSARLAISLVSPH